jgi:tetratricopeptide (TPR) repeat protein
VASASAEPVGTVEEALDHAVRLLRDRPDLALAQTGEILQRFPGHPLALLVEGMARRTQGDIPAALQVLEPLARSQPTAAAVHFELGLALGAAAKGEAALAALHRAVQLNPGLTGAWLALAEHLAATGDVAGADRAYAFHIKSATRDPRLLKPAAALCANDIPVAEALLRAYLKENPTDVAAIRMFAEVAARLGRLIDAETLLARCIELAPGFAQARSHYAMVLSRQNRPAEALPHVERLLLAEPNNPNYRNLKATVLVAIGEYQHAIDLYTQILAEYPNQAKVWLSFGHVLKTAGRRSECIHAYRKALELAPGLGEAYWSLANLKTFRFDAVDVAAMRHRLELPKQSVEDKLHLHFALGKACEDEADFAASFEHYSAGNSLRRTQIAYSAADTSRLVQRSRRLYTSEFFAARAGMGCPAPDPIFIVGLPRSGSTLLEQILASHPLVEGTMELYDMISLARSLGASAGQDRPAAYPDSLAALDAGQLRSLGEQYLARTRIQRKTPAPFFVDKMPNNLLHVGLIHLTLPNARIIDARRHPIGCCFSAFKQHFARGQHFSYSLEDVGRYYRDYVELMAHFDTVLPGRIYRVNYESMIEDTESEVRRLLEHCGLPFEERCLRFHENERAVRTASSEQVRQPIFRDGLEQWRHYEPWLTPLREALGPVLEA